MRDRVMVPTSELGSLADKLVEQTSRTGEPIVLTRNDRPTAVLVPYREYLRLLQNDRDHLRSTFAEMLERMAARNGDVPDDEIERDIEQARAEIRAERAS